MTTSVIRSWRSLKDASIHSVGSTSMLRLIWRVESIVGVPGQPVVGGGDRGTFEERQFSEAVEIVPWSKELYEAFHAAGDRLLTEDEVAKLLRSLAR